MKIATYNVNGISSRLPVLLRWLEATKPDVACLQELKAVPGNFPEQTLRDAGYSALWQGQKSWNGVAILSRGQAPVERQRGLPGNESDEQSRYLEADVAGISIGCLYLPNGNPAPGPKFDYKLEWMRHFSAHARSLMDSGKPVVLAGDYNIIPTETDAYKAERWVEDALFRPESRQLFRDLLAQGWVDAVRHMLPNETVYTYWDYFRSAFSRNAGIRIDHLLCSPALTGRLTAAGVDRQVRGWEKTSDHAPVWITIDEKEKS